MSKLTQHQQPAIALSNRFSVFTKPTAEMQEPKTAKQASAVGKSLLVEPKQKKETVSKSKKRRERAKRAALRKQQAAAAMAAKSPMSYPSTSAAKMSQFEMLSYALAETLSLPIKRVSTLIRYFKSQLSTFKGTIGVLYLLSQPPHVIAQFCCSIMECGSDELFKDSLFNVSAGEVPIDSCQPDNKNGTDSACGECTGYNIDPLTYLDAYKKCQGDAAEVYPICTDPVDIDCPSNSGIGGLFNQCWPAADIIVGVTVAVSFGICACGFYRKATKEKKVITDRVKANNRGVDQARSDAKNLRGRVGEMFKQYGAMDDQNGQQMQERKVPGEQRVPGNQEVEESDEEDEYLGGDYRRQQPMQQV